MNFEPTDYDPNLKPISGIEPGSGSLRNPVGAKTFWPGTIQDEFIAEVIIARDGDHVTFKKNRFGATGQASLGTIIEMAVNLIAHQYFGNKLDFFKHSLMADLKEAILKVIDEYKTEDQRRERASNFRIPLYKRWLQKFL